LVEAAVMVVRDVDVDEWSSSSQSCTCRPLSRSFVRTAKTRYLPFGQSSLSNTIWATCRVGRSNASRSTVCHAVLFQSTALTRLGVSFAEARVTRAQARAEHGVRLGDAREDQALPARSGAGRRR